MQESLYIKYFYMDGFFEPDMGMDNNNKKIIRLISRETILHDIPNNKFTPYSSNSKIEKYFRIPYESMDGKTKYLECLIRNKIPNDVSDIDSGMYLNIDDCTEFLDYVTNNFEHICDLYPINDSYHICDNYFVREMFIDSIKPNYEYDDDTEEEDNHEEENVHIVLTNNSKSYTDTSRMPTSLSERKAKIITDKISILNKYAHKDGFVTQVCDSVYNMKLFSNRTKRYPNKIIGDSEYKTYFNCGGVECRVLMHPNNNPVLFKKIEIIEFIDFVKSNPSIASQFELPGIDIHDNIFMRNIFMEYLDQDQEQNQ